MKRETWDILLALESGKIDVIEAHKKIMEVNKWFCTSLLTECMNHKHEVLMSPIRFDGVHVNKIEEVFRRNGIVQERIF